MEDELERLKRKRATFRTLVSKMLNKIDESIETHDKNEIEESYELLLERKRSLKELDEEIQKIIDLKSLESDVLTSEEYQEKCSRAIKRVNREIGQNKPRINSAEQITNSIPSVQSSVKLPKLEFEKYSGDPKKFTEFWNSFESTINQNPNLTIIEKFAYLKTLLTGTASNVVASLDLTERNYEECLKTLKDRFGNKDIIISQFMNKLLNMEPVRNSYNIKGLRKLFDEIEIAVRNLETQGVTKGSFGQLLIPILLKSIPEEFVLEFNRKKKRSDDISVEDLLDFIKVEIECREASYLLTQEKRNIVTQRSENTKFDNKKFSRNVPTAASYSVVDSRTCIFCNKCHDSFSCDKNVKEKLYKLRNQNRCFVCFNKFHVSSRCRNKNKTKCSKCGSLFHHESVCNRNINQNETQLVSNQSVNNKTEMNEKQMCPTLSVSQNHVSCKGNILLQTCSVLVHSAFQSELTNLILDSGATRSFIDGRLVKNLKLKIIDEENLSVFSFGNKSAVTKNYKVTELLISDPKKKNKIKIRCLVTDIISVAPFVSASDCTYKALHDLGLPAAEAIEASVGILIGLDFYYKIVNSERIQITDELFAVSTLFGFVPSGLEYGSDKGKNLYQNNVIVNLSSCVRDSLETLWSLDCLGITDYESEMKNCKSDVIAAFEKEIEFRNGRYFVPLLWKCLPHELENNFTIASRRFETLKNRLIRNSEIMQQYKGVIEEQLKLDIIEECSAVQNDASYFMPHREIIKPSETTSCRIVYDASSSRTKGIKSLNDFLDIGPNLTPLILSIILKFRTFEIAFSGDIAKAFLMIGILEKDRNYLKFLWFGDKEQECKVLRFKRLSFGLRCSPAVLALTIKHHIKKYATTNLESYEMLDTSMYVDDLYYGADNVNDAFRLSTDAVEIFKDAGMQLRKLQSNSEELNSLWVEKGFEISSSRESKFLGMIWIPDTDLIRLNNNISGLIENTKISATKRLILKTAASVFDPMGLFQPYIIRMKILLQKLWTLGVDWDEILPPEFTDIWRCWLSELSILQTFQVPRKFFHDSNYSELSLHIFADASPKAFGAVGYFRYFSKNCFRTTFIAAKGRVAPIKAMTLPRLELMAALVAAKLAKYVQSVLPNLTDKLFLWSDSQITLYWIKGCARNWKPFVCNRVQEIQSITEPGRWFHCSGKQNPADLISRGEKASNLVNSPLWLYGPDWLSEHESAWPITPLQNVDEDNILNERVRSVDALQVSVHSDDVPVLFDLKRFTKLSKVYRITSYVLRFINNCQKKSVKFTGPLCAKEMQRSELIWIKLIQRKHFSKEVLDLSRGKVLDKKSSIFSLNPFLDEDGCLRLKGRLQFSAALNFEEKHPCVLPYKEYFCDLIIMDAHHKVLHAGVESTLAQIRERFWIVKARLRIKTILHKCFVCKRYNAKGGMQEIAPLPSDRVMESPPFAVTGLDYAGPFFTRDSQDKHYLLLFTCAVTRAIHLELVPSMKTELFLLAFRKFIARRGLCSCIMSDNAKTFKKADADLQKIWQHISHPAVKNLFASHAIEWKFIVEKGAWWGGFWERHFRTIKKCLRKIIGRSSLSLNELETVFFEIEAMINSRPITYICDDQSEPSPLTPSHFLVGKRLLSLPVSKVTNLDFSGEKRSTMMRRYKLQQTMLTHFWNRWKRSYLMSLRSMNICPSKGACLDFKVGDVVLIHDDRVPRNLWPMGRIIITYPGRDGKIRSCLLKTGSGNVRRPIQLLYNLEVSDD